MAAKTKKTTKPEAAILARKNMVIKVNKDDSQEEMAEKYARVMLSPEYAAFRVLNCADGKTDIFKDVDVPILVDHLRKHAAAVNSGDMTQAEAMLLNQATALQTLFARLAERAMWQEYMPNIEAYMRLSLRAQNQCRATLETLAAIKNPPVIFAKQANISGGHQQINNGTPATASHAEKNINQPNELLSEVHHGETLDTRGTSKAIRNNPTMATVG